VTFTGYASAEWIASGGMAEIFLAHRAGDLQKKCVIKRMRPDYRNRPEFVEMFLDEARLAASFHHKNLPQVFEVGWDGDLPYYAMEYLDGADCDQLKRAARKQDGTLPLQWAIAIVVGAASGLHYAHFSAESDGKLLRIVHRDVSPSNIFVTVDGAVKVVDFGVALSEQRRTKTTDGTLKGKLAYMSPEQINTGDVDHRSDLFSLGIVLYELCTGKHPFADGRSELAALTHIAEGVFLPPSAVCDDFPPGLEDIIVRCLAFDPKDRFATADELADALEDFATAAGLSLSSRRLGAYVESLLDPYADVSIRTAMQSSLPQLDLALRDIAASAHTADVLPIAAEGASPTTRIERPPSLPDEDVSRRPSRLLLVIPALVAVAVAAAGAWWLMDAQRSTAPRAATPVTQPANDQGAPVPASQGVEARAAEAKVAEEKEVATREPESAPETEANGAKVETANDPAAAAEQSRPRRTKPRRTVKRETHDVRRPWDQDTPFPPVRTGK